MVDSALEETLQALDAFVSYDNQQRSRVRARRQIWIESAKQTIRDTFSEIVPSNRSCERGLVVDAGGEFENLQAVQLRFASIPTGIWYRTAQKRSVGIERGAILVFQQTESGRIVVLRYPFSSELPGQTGRNGNDFQRNGVYEPEQITREFVLEQAKDFFDWATRMLYPCPAESLNPRSIGFVPPPVED